MAPRGKKRGWKTVADRGYRSGLSRSGSGRRVKDAGGRSGLYAIGRKRRR